MMWIVDTRPPADASAFPSNAVRHSPRCPTIRPVACSVVPGRDVAPRGPSGGRGRPSLLRCRLAGRLALRPDRTGLKSRRLAGRLALPGSCRGIEVLPAQHFGRGEVGSPDRRGSRRPGNRPSSGRSSRVSGRTSRLMAGEPVSAPARPCPSPPDERHLGSGRTACRRGGRCRGTRPAARRHRPSATNPTGRSSATCPRRSPSYTPRSCSSLRYARIGSNLLPTGRAMYSVQSIGRP